MKKRFISLAIAFIMLFSLLGCGGEEKTAENIGEDTETTEENKTEANTAEVSNSVYIVYTNDVHSYIYNTIKEDEVEKPGLRFSNVAALVADMKAEGKNVILVDAGDEIQGDVYGAIDEGKSVIKLMNLVGYELATPGNHEFDYGMFTFFQRVDEADYPFVSCNFYSIEDNEYPLEPYHIFEKNGKKIAFVGITTPETITSSTPTYFQDEAGNYIYTIDGIGDVTNMYAKVQEAVDKASKEADYVIALAHVGVGADEIKDGISSYDVISHVSGLDAYIDGHSHTTLEKELVKDKDGKDVLLTQTGSYLSNVGVMEITESGIDTKLINEYENTDAEVAALEDEIHKNLMDKMGERIAVLDTTLYINDPVITDRRLVRAQETNSGDFAADSVYWYLNDVTKQKCDVVFINGGCVRAQLEKGDIRYLETKSVQPFGNMICIIEVTGQQILDALEMGASVVEKRTDKSGRLTENGAFLHVSGLRYTIDTSVPSSLKTKADGMFESIEGEYRVKDVQVYNRESGVYEPLDLEKKYNIGGINYILRNNGDGLSMFAGADMVIDYVGQDYIIYSEYMKNFTKENGMPLVKTENSPLIGLTGFMLDYENPYGAGRIEIK